MMKIAIIGFGAIGKYVFDNLKKEKIFITSLICRPGREEAAREVLKSNLEIYNSIDQYKEYPNLILDCAGHSSLIDYAPDALCRGINFITLSSGALADDKLFNKIKKSEVKGKSKLIIASGAIGSLDILTSAKNDEIYEVCYTGRKPPQGWVGSRAEKILDLKNLKSSSQIHFSGNARQASKLYPKNANVTATIAMSGIGFDKTKVILIADNSITENIHELKISGKFGSSNFQIYGKPLPNNPKSSSLAAMSMISEVKKILELF